MLPIAGGEGSFFGGVTGYNSNLTSLGEFILISKSFPLMFSKLGNNQMKVKSRTAKRYIVQFIDTLDAPSDNNV